MSLKHAILGFISWNPLTGYELKKLFADSPVLPWSGNSNQIYTTLVDLHNEGLVSMKVEPQPDRPARKVYAITEAGRAELRRWVVSPPELPEIRNTFLVQLGWANLLSPDELDGLLAKYEEEVNLHLLMLKEQQRRGIQGAATPSRRETYLWRMIVQNRVADYEKELAWVREVRQGLRGM